ncbi:MAG: hypothetical protein WC623_12250 [Pedobacter sp.]|uniref:hypothetical protein n=1 Tax=Pedobacter sp. TaxID=1411316 RepID=UPI0035687C18
MKYFIFIFLLTSCSFRAEQIKRQQKSCRGYYEKSIGSYIYTSVDEMPVYPGGMNALSLFFAKNMVYPPQEENKTLQTKLFLTFVIDTLGNSRVLAKASISKRNNSLIDNEVLRLTKLMLKWEPGKCNRDKVSVRLTIPFVISPQ